MALENFLSLVVVGIDLYFSNVDLNIPKCIMKTIHIMINKRADVNTAITKDKLITPTQIKRKIEVIAYKIKPIILGIKIAIINWRKLFTFSFKLSSLVTDLSQIA